ncbi:MAG: DUF3379 family protein [Pseudomonadales bacterium]|nr:DUF3379 family protein [Pseudomonadales bacterium]
MNCLDFRRQILATPKIASEELQAHEESCASCRQFRQEILELDDNLYAALQVDVPADLEERLLQRQPTASRPRAPYWISAAAVVVLALAATLFYGLSGPEPVGEELVAHLELEADYIADHLGPVQPARLDEILNKVDTRLGDPVPGMVFADNCIMNGQLIAHFVVEENGEKYTVLLVPHSKVDSEVTFGHEGWRGIVRPHQSGGLAILGDRDHASNRVMDNLADRYTRALVKQGV